MKFKDISALIDIYIKWNRGQTMNNAFYEEREKAVIDILQEKGRATVEEFCDSLGVSASTVRLLLRKMHEKGLIVRTHGGAIKADYPSRSAQDSGHNNIAVEGISNAEKKRQIAAIAAATVDDGDSIAISSGSTAYLMALLLTDRKNLTVVTDSVPVANALLFKEGIRVLICGGQIRERNGACFGPTAESFFQTLQVDKSYSGCDSVNMDFGITSLDIDPRTEKSLILCGKTKYILADSSKFNVKPFMEKTVDLSEIDFIVSDSSLDRRYIEKMKEKNINVLI